MLVHSAVPITETLRGRIAAAGGVIDAYIPTNTLAVVTRDAAGTAPALVDNHNTPRTSHFRLILHPPCDAAVEAIAAMPWVGWVGTMRGAYKVSPRLSKRAEAAAWQRGNAPSGPTGTLASVLRAVVVVVVTYSNSSLCCTALSPVGCQRRSRSRPR